MKAARKAIDQYDTELPLAISVLERRAQSSNTSLESYYQETSRYEGVSLDDLERRRDQHANVLSSSKYEQVPLKNKSESLYYFPRSDNEEANSFGTGKKQIGS